MLMNSVSLLSSNSTELFNYTALLLEVSSYRLTDWFTVSGSAMAFILGILKIIEYKQDQIDLIINIKDAYFTTEPVNAVYDSGGTRADFLINIRNKGRQPTTISRIDLFSDNPNYNDLRVIYSIYEFKPIRIEGNDSIELKLFTKKMIYLEDSNELKCTLKFETSHKKIAKETKVNRKN